MLYPAIPQQVPDRGGRAWETRPPPEMPSFQPRVEHTPKPDNRGKTRQIIIR